MKAPSKKTTGKKTLRQLALQNNRKNKSRSILMMLAILLSTMLLTAIMSYGVGMVRYEQQSAEALYGRYYGMLTHMTPEQAAAVRQSEAFTELGFFEECGYVESESLISLKALDATALELACMENRIVEGTYPEAEDEILLQRGMLKACGCPDVSIGDSITLSIRPDPEKPYFEKTFRVSGFLTEDADASTADSYGAFVSESFHRQYCPEDDTCHALFRMAEDIPMDYETAEETVRAYAAECGLSDTQVSLNSMYILLALNPGNDIQLACGLLVVLVMIFSMIVIYNIFQISLVQRIQEYGRLLAIGTTERQLKQLINREGMLLALPSIPAGAVLGYLTARISFAWLIGTVQSLQSMQLQGFRFLSVPAVLGSVVAAFLTVRLAMLRPKRTVAKLSPVEAISFREGMAGNRSRKQRRRSGGTGRAEGLRKGHNSVNERTLAFANIAAGKRQTVVTMLTMGLSCVMLVVMMNCLGNIDTEYEARKSVPHGRFQISLDYTFYDSVYPENNLDQILSDNPIDEAFLQALRDIDGVTNVTTRDYLVIDRQGQLEALCVLSREDFDFERNKGGSKGVLDYDSASKEDRLLYGWSFFLEDCGLALGDDITCQLWNGTENKAFTGALDGAFGSLTGGWAITEDTYAHLGYEAGSSVGTVWIDCSEKDAARVEEQIRALLRSRRHLDLETLEHNLEEQTFGTRVMRYGIYSLLTIIGFIGFMNMANTMIISITTRKREYGILQAVGMTDRQLNRSLVLQGVLYVSGTMLISMAVGLPLGYLAFVKFKSIAGFGMNVYHFPLIELLVLAGVLLMMQLVLSRLLSSNLKRDSLVERIRY